MADAQLVGIRGTTIGYHLQVAVDGQAIDLTLPGTTVVFNAKRRRADTAALITKTYRSLPATTDPGFTILAATTDTLDLEIAPADTATFTATEFLVFDAVLTEPSGRVTTIAKGSLTVSVGVGT